VYQETRDDNFRAGLVGGFQVLIPPLESRRTTAALAITRFGETPRSPQSCVRISIL
jgi:hypothetical protein